MRVCQSGLTPDQNIKGMVSKKENKMERVTIEGKEFVLNRLIGKGKTQDSFHIHLKNDDKSMLSRELDEFLSELSKVASQIRDVDIL